MYFYDLLKLLYLWQFFICRKILAAAESLKKSIYYRKMGWFS